MSEGIQITCPQCGQSYALQPEQWGQYVGRNIPCSKCGQVFTVTGPGVGTRVAAPVAGYQTAPASGSGYGAPPRTSGIAIASLILGIASILLPVVLSIPAIICAAIGMSKTKDARVGGRGMAIAGLVLGICTVSMGACYISILFPALNRAREQANRIKCAANMRMIGQAMIMYANQERDGAFPDTLDHLMNNSSISVAELICPSSHDTSATTPAGIHAPGHLSYVYVGAGLKNTAGGDTVLLYEPITNHQDGGNFLFGDGHVEFAGKVKAQKMISEVQGGQNPPPAFSNP